MIPELTYLGLGVALLLVHVVVQSTLSDLSKGIGWALGPQDERREQNVFADRIERALKNYTETFAAYVALALALAVSERASGTSALGATIWFWARVAYIPAFASGIPLVRSVAWLSSIGGLILMLIALLTG
ncbi:MAG: MAPEG family protein [Pseudomonadota bacterium]